MESAVTRIELPEPKSAATHSQPQEGISLKLCSGARIRVMRRMESVVARIQLLELKSAVGRSQRQVVSNHCNSSQPQDTISISCNSSSGGWIQTCIEPPDLESTRGWNQPQLVSNRPKSSQPQDEVSRKLHPAVGTQDNRRIESAGTRIQPRFRNQ